MTGFLAAAGSSPSGSGGKSWVTEIDPALQPERGPLQVLSSKHGKDGPS